MKELEELKDFSKLLSIASGAIIKKYWRTKINIQLKKDQSPVTVADRLAEEKMRELILKEFPEHGIIGEEFPAVNENAEYKWILDPIDGTKSFICGTITFGTLIALTKNNEPVLGIINQPIMNELLTGDNLSAELNGERVYVRECLSLDQAVLLTTDHLNIKKYHNINKFDALTEKVKLYRNWGDCYGYYLVATGFADIMVDAIMSLWDIMALIPIIKGAGGIISDYNGNDPAKGKSIIAAVPNLHQEVINILN